jgi:hypothetical protein
MDINIFYVIYKNGDNHGQKIQRSNKRRAASRAVQRW